MDDEGKRLADIVKQTHKRLRKRYRMGEDETQLWKEHILQNKELQTYANAMHTLATQYWEPRSQINTSRVHWIHNAVIQYFYKGDQERAYEKEKRKLSYLGLEADSDDLINRCHKAPLARLTLLDVGSCYNPFSVYEDYDVTAIDLYPALPSVRQCDFLALQVTSEVERNSDSEDSVNKEADVKSKESRTRQNVDEMPSREVLRTVSDEGSTITASSLQIKENMTPPLKTSTTASPDTLVDERIDKCPSCDAYAKKSSKTVNLKDKNSDDSSEKTSEDAVSEDKIEKRGEYCYNESITSIHGLSYDIVVFCLLLEYIPSPKQRYLCCKKAYNILKPNGILCIITPDSKHQTANVHLYKLWKITLAYLGFSRIKYEKQNHFHGMIFRKGLCKRAWELDASRELEAIKKTNVKDKFVGIDYDKVVCEIYIPQDFQDLSESDDEPEEKRQKIIK